MPVYEIGLNDGRRLRIEADDQEAALAGVDHFQNSTTPSGTLAGIQHGAQELLHGDAETAKQYAGAGDGFAPKDTSYVPANLTNGSYNPLNWNWSQAPQKVAEVAPGIAQDALVGMAGKKLLGAPGAIIGSALSAYLRTAGDDAKKTAEVRSSNPDAQPETQDLVRGGLTSAAAAAVGSLAPLRFIPGSGRITEVGSKGALQSVQKYLATTGITGASSAASDAATQLGTTGTYDPKQGLEATAGGLVTGGAMAAPRGIADVARSGSLREFGGDNREALTNYATRLQTAGEDGLGKTIGGATVDETAHQTVVQDLKNELRDAASNVRKQVPLMGPDADNALQRAHTGQPITARDVDLIDQATTGAPDGDNAAYLARTLRVAQLAHERGSADSQGWAGGLSGVMDKNLGFMLNPVRLAGGTLATALGMHLLGLSNPMFAGSVAGAYGGARMLDQLTGARSPAKMFADHFADMQNATLRKAPNAPQAPMLPPQAPPAAPLAPWGPRPPGPSVPPVAPPATPAAPQSPMAPLPSGPTASSGTVAASALLSKITKSNGKVKTTDPFADVGSYAPIPDDKMTYRGMQPRDYADFELNRKQAEVPSANRDNYWKSTFDTASARQQALTDLTQMHPQEASGLNALHDQLMEINNDKQRGLAAVNHYANQMAPNAAAAVRGRFAKEQDRIWPKRKHSKKTAPL